MGTRTNSLEQRAPVVILLNESGPNPLYACTAEAGSNQVTDLARRIPP